MLSAHSPLRRSLVFDLYLRTFRRDYWKRTKRDLVEFYRQFVGPDSLVFDIGANSGDHAAAFLAIGARLVAVEPLPSCWAQLNALHPKHRVTVLPCAVGAESGTATFHICSTGDWLSTLSTDWIKTARESGSYEGMHWDKELPVEVRTVDSLIAQFGMPDFIKIDVEGAESDVLDGLSRAPKYMRFEFHRQTVSEAIACIRKPCFPPSARFNYIIGDPCGPLMLSDWVQGKQLENILCSPAIQEHEYGDILVVT